MNNFMFGFGIALIVYYLAIGFALSSQFKDTEIKVAMIIFVVPSLLLAIFNVLEWVLR